MIAARQLPHVDQRILCFALPIAGCIRPVQAMARGVQPFRVGHYLVEFTCQTLLDLRVVCGKKDDRIRVA